MRSTSAARALRRTRARLIPVVLAVLLAAGVDWYVRNDTMDRFLRAAEEADRTLNRAALEIRTARDKVVAEPAAQPTWGLELQTKAAEHAHDLLTTCRPVFETSALPWHTALRSARDNFVAHCDAWLGFLSLVAQDWRNVETPVPGITATFHDARAAAERAVPSAPLHDADARVARIFTE